MSDTEVRLRAALDQVPAYIPGKPASAPEGVTAYKVSSNENPYPPLPSVLEVVREAAGSINRYPDMAVTELTEALAEHLGVPVEHIATGTGSVGVLGQVIAATCDAGDEVVFAWRSFEAYPIVTASPAPRRSGCRSTTTGATTSTPCSRRSPTAPRSSSSAPPTTRPARWSTHAELERFLDAGPGGRARRHRRGLRRVRHRPRRRDGLELYRDHPNVVVLRTFSKAYGLAGLRVGYAVAHPPVADALRKTATPFGVNSIAQAAAIASLRAFDELRSASTQLVTERARVVEALRGQGWFIPETRPTSCGSAWVTGRGLRRRGAGRRPDAAPVRRRRGARHDRRDRGQRRPDPGRRRVPRGTPRA